MKDLAIREQIIEHLRIKFPSKKSNEGIHWSNIERAFSDNKNFKRTTLKRYLGLIKDDATASSFKYDSESTLEEIGKIILGNVTNHKKIILESANTSNFEGHYLIISPSSTGEKLLNIFPVEIFSNGDFCLNYINKNDEIKGITAFVTNHISFFSNQRFSNGHGTPFVLHSVFYIQSSSSRSDLRAISVGVATRKKRNTAELKAVLEVLIKIDKPTFNLFKSSALTLEKDGDAIYLVKDAVISLNDENEANQLLSSEIEIESRISKGRINRSVSNLREIINKLYTQLFFITNHSTSSIEATDSTFKTISDITNQLISESQLTNAQ